MIATLRESIGKVLDPLLSDDKRFALLDFPDHPNVGDSAIWLGAINYFRQNHGVAPSYVSTYDGFSWQALECAVPSGPVFLNGGGNFGTLWPHHQCFREAILERLRDRLVVQLPQSIYFDSVDALKRSAAIINAHPNFVLLVRDKRSYDIAASALRCRTLLCPDMAYWLGPQLKPTRPHIKLLLLMRTDKEAAVDWLATQDLPDDATIVDWLQEEPNLYAKTKRLTIATQFIQLGRHLSDRHRHRELLFRGMAQKRVRRGLRALSSAEFIITDRLHGYILSTLLGLPTIVLDNSYGKISSFIDTWTKGFNPIFCQNFSEAIGRYAEMRSTEGADPSAVGCRA